MSSILENVSNESIIFLEMASGIKERIGWNDINNGNSNIWKCFLAEYMGNVLLNFLGCASVINVIDPAQPPNLVLIALTFGLTVFIIVQVCHFTKNMPPAQKKKSSV